MSEKSCSICGELNPIKLLGWFGECPNCLFLMETFNLSVEEVKKRRVKPTKPNKDKEVGS